MSLNSPTLRLGHSRLATSSIAKAAVGLMLISLCAPSAHAKRKYTFTPNSSPGAGDWSFTCKKVEKAALADNDAQTVVVINTTASLDDIEIWSGLEMFEYDAALSREYTDSWYNEDDGSQFLAFTSAPQPSPDIGLEVQIPLEILAPDNSLKQIFMTDTATETSDEPVIGALVNVTERPSADANVNVSGGTTNEVVHSCSTVSAPVGMGSIAGLMALGLLRRRRQS